MIRGVVVVLWSMSNANASAYGLNPRKSTDAVGASERILTWFSCSATTDRPPSLPNDLMLTLPTRPADIIVRVPGAATRRPGHQSRHAWGIGSRFSPTRLTKTLRLALGSRR
jgi:hypothetical protein